MIIRRFHWALLLTKSDSYKCLFLCIGIEIKDVHFVCVLEKNDHIGTIQYGKPKASDFVFRIILISVK